MKTTHLQLAHRERALAGMRASQQGISLTEYVSRLIQRDADQAGLSQYLDADNTLKVEARHGR
jgi:hypothetical protein